MIVVKGDVAAAWMRRMRPYRKRTPVMAVEMPDDFTITVEGRTPVAGTLVAAKGGYLAYNETDDGEVNLYAIPGDKFAALYEPIEEDGG
jgi:hypothetical protein